MVLFSSEVTLKPVNTQNIPENGYILKKNKDEFFEGERISNVAIKWHVGQKATGLRVQGTH